MVAYVDLHMDDGINSDEMSCISVGIYHDLKLPEQACISKCILVTMYTIKLLVGERDEKFGSRC